MGGIDKGFALFLCGAKKSEENRKKVLTKAESFDILTERLRESDAETNKSVGSEKYSKKGVDKRLRVC